MANSNITPTHKQIEAIEYLARDYIVKEIAAELHVGTQAITDRLDRAKDRFGIKTLPALVAEAEKNNLINVRLLKSKPR